MKGNRVLSTGFNSIRYSHFTQLPTSHAEAAAIVGLLKENRLADLCGASIYVTRFTKSGSVSCARPCGKCMELIQAVGIKDIIYTDFNGETKEMKV